MRVAVIGAGMQAKAVCFDLLKQPDINEILVTDLDYSKSREVERLFDDSRISAIQMDACDVHQTSIALRGCSAAISTAPYRVNPYLTAAAIAANCSLCDLGGNNIIVDRQLAQNNSAEEAGVTIVPAVGLAPGLPAIVVADSIKHFDIVDSVSVRVGGVPQKRGGLLDYSLTFSIEGLINEYVEPDTALECGQPVSLASLERVESIEFPPPFGVMEAFTTSGALSTLPKSYYGQIRNLDYKTVRHPGHAKIMRAIRDLGLLSGKALHLSPQDVAVSPRQIFELMAGSALDTHAPDTVLFRATVFGYKDHCFTKRVYQMIEYPSDGLTAMTRTTAFSASIVLLMLARGQIEKKGCVPIEVCVDPDAYLMELRSRGIDLQVTDTLM